MADVEKKARMSGEQPRAVEPTTILPVANTPVEKSPPPPSLHPAFYVVYVPRLMQEAAVSDKIR